jgi:hypothetical protein
VSLAERAKLPRLAKAAKHVKVLTIDVERAPGVGYFWDPWGANITPDKMQSEPRIMSFAAKWLGDKNVIFHDERSGHEAMIRAGWDLLSEADIVVTYNGEKADIPWFNEHFADYGLGPTAPFKSVDLIKSNRKKFKLVYRRLDYLAGRYVGAVKDHTDFQLWLDCLAGDAKQWARMQKYNENDVRLTEKLYLQLLPWLVDQPHMGVMIGDGNQRRCSFCGGAKLRLHTKQVHAFVRTYQLFRCESCLGWNRSTILTGQGQFTRPIR